jgi:hypothetical protein
MGRYSNLVGKRVEAHYRASDIHLVVVGTLASDTNKSVFVEEHFSQGGKDKTLRVEIPYEYVIRVLEVTGERSESPEPVSSSSKNPF